MIVVVLSICPEKLRGELTRWLLEISTGVYVGYVPARVRELLWLRIVEDVGRGRALMVHATHGEQRLSFRVHNHAWDVVDYDGVALMRRTTAESREAAERMREHRAERQSAATSAEATSIDGARGTARLDEADTSEQGNVRRNWSKAAQRRRFKNAVETRHQRGE